MHKIILYFGLLVFCISLIFYSQKEIPIEQMVIRSLMIFAVVSIAASILALIFIRAINHALVSRNEGSNDYLEQGNHE